MAEFTPKLVADVAGVWREEYAGKRFGIGWNEVYAVSGYKLDGGTAIYTVIVLDFSYGHFLELSGDWPGFEQVYGSQATVDCLPSSWSSPCR